MWMTFLHQAARVIELWILHVLGPNPLSKQVWVPFAVFLCICIILYSPMDPHTRVWRVQSYLLRRYDRSPIGYIVKRRIRLFSQRFLLMIIQTGVLI